MAINFKKILYFYMEKLKPNTKCSYNISLQPLLEEALLFFRVFVDWQFRCENGKIPVLDLRRVKKIKARKIP